MDTDEGQRTTARLLEEAHRLSTAAREPTYASIDETLSATLQGSEAAISNILSTPDPREIHKLETGEKNPTPVEMKASLPAGSFSPFNFEKEFHMRHGMNPEDADKPWHEYYQPQGMLRKARISGKERRFVDNENSLAVSLTEDLETLRTPGVVRNLDYTERGLYAENILAFDAQLLQDIISGQWSRQQMYGSTPRWYQDSFYDITPLWMGQYRESHAPFENTRSLPTYSSRHRYLLLGPPSDITSTAGPPSTVGPSASESRATTTAKKVDFSMVHDIEETSSASSQMDVPRQNVKTTQLKDKPFALEGRISEGVSQQREIFPTDERRQKPNITSLEIRDMDITTSDCDVYYGVYPDFQLPLPNRPRISDLFVGNTRLISNTNSPMSILCIPSLKKMYGTTEFAIDRLTGQLYKIGDVDVTLINLFGGIPDEDLHGNDVKTMTSLLEKPQATSTSIPDVPRNMSNETIMEGNIPIPTPMIFIPSQEEGRTKSSTTVVEDVPPEGPILNLNRVNVQVASSVSSLEEGEGIVNEDEYEKDVYRLEKINKKITILLQNWSEESKQARNTNEITEIKSSIGLIWINIIIDERSWKD